MARRKIMMTLSTAWDLPKHREVLRSSLCSILKIIEDGHPITDVFIEKRATAIRATHNAKEATVGVSDLRREPAEKHAIQGAAIAIAKPAPLNPDVHGAAASPSTLASITAPAPGRGNPSPRKPLKVKRLSPYPDHSRTAMGWSSRNPFAKAARLREMWHNCSPLPAHSSP